MRKESERENNILKLRRTRINIRCNVSNDSRETLPLNTRCNCTNKKNIFKFSFFCNFNENIICICKDSRNHVLGEYVCSPRYRSFPAQFPLMRPDPENSVHGQDWIEVLLISQGSLPSTLNFNKAGPSLVPPLPTLALLIRPRPLNVGLELAFISGVYLWCTSQGTSNVISAQVKGFRLLPLLGSACAADSGQHRSNLEPLNFTTQSSG